MGVVVRTHAVTPSASHFQVVRARGTRSREGTVSKPLLEVKAAVSGIEIQPEGEEWIVDTCDVITLVSQMYDLSDYMLKNFTVHKVGPLLKSAHIYVP